MKLSTKFLKNVTDVNNFQYISQWDISEGSSQKLYFQIIDKMKENIRYMTQATVFNVTVTFLSIDESNEIIKTATQPFSDDKSIWYIELDVTEIPNSGAVKFSITEDGTEKKWKVDQAIVVELLESGGC